MDYFFGNFSAKTYRKLIHNPLFRVVRNRGTRLIGVNRLMPDYIIKIAQRSQTAGDKHPYDSDDANLYRVICADYMREYLERNNCQYIRIPKKMCITFLVNL